MSKKEGRGSKYFQLDLASDWTEFSQCTITTFRPDEKREESGDSLLTRTFWRHGVFMKWFFTLFDLFLIFKSKTVIFEESSKNHTFSPSPGFLSTALKMLRQRYSGIHFDYSSRYMNKQTNTSSHNIAILNNEMFWNSPVLDNLWRKFNLYGLVLNWNEEYYADQLHSAEFVFSKQNVITEIRTMTSRRSKFKTEVPRLQVQNT